MPKAASLILGVAIMIASGWGIYAASAWPWKAALFPLVIAVPLFCLAVAEVLWTLLGTSAAAQAADFKLADHLPRDVMLRRTALAAGWIVALLAAIVLVGFVVAVPLFVFLYLRLQGKERWLFSAVFTAVVWGVFYGLFDLLLHLPFPAGWIQEWMGLG